MRIVAKLAFTVCAIALVLLVSYLFFYTHQEPNLKTVFSYSVDDLKTLHNLTSQQEITLDNIDKWNNIIFDLIKANKLGDAYAARVYAYVYAAQRDAAFLSKNLTGKWQGTLDVVTEKTLCLFFPKDCDEISLRGNTDAYSDALANVVIIKIKQRIESDTQKTLVYPEKSGQSFWAGVRPYYGQEVGSWQPWFLQSGIQFRAAAPDLSFQVTQRQLNLTKTALKNITPSQTERVVFWAGNPGSVTPPGQWLIISNDYMNSNNISLEKTLLIHSVLAMGIEDAVIAVFDSKYTYWVKRPNMLDTSIHTVMPTPNHPSYPAAHATISAAAATILTHYFPQNKSYWDEEAHEAADTRVWAGIHYPQDIETGYQLGMHVGEYVVK